MTRLERKNVSVAPRGQLLKVPREPANDDACLSVVTEAPEAVRRPRLSLKLGMLALGALLVSALPFAPSSVETATAYVVSEGEQLVSSLRRLASVYEREQGAHRLEGASVRLAAIQKPVEPNPPVGVELVASPAVEEVDPLERVDHQTLVNKVRGIIRKHAPRNRNVQHLAEAIVTTARARGYDPLFVAAVIKSESAFNSSARSHKGAQGLMQLMPKTGAWVAKQHELSKGSLTDPGYNLELGIRYLRYLENMYDGDRVFTLIAYNWGPGRVASASEGERKVPPEVVRYAIKILNDYRRWRSELVD